MAEMALGYGSEYQLLRYLGHHRNFLDSKIKEATKSDSPIEWMDYPVDKNVEKRVSLDGEWTDVRFLEHLQYPNYERISKMWGDFWPKKGHRPSWDGIFQQDEVLYIVEAKAHTEELENPTNAKDENSMKIIKKAFEQVTHNPSKAELWLKSKYYQLANRIALVHFLNSQGIKAKVCYIFFLNGYLKDTTMNVIDEKVFHQAFEEECNTLQLTTEEKAYIVPVVIDAKEDGFATK